MVGDRPSDSVKATVGELAAQLASKDYTVRTNASKSLVAIGEPAVAALCERLRDRSENVALGGGEGAVDDREPRGRGQPGRGHERP